MLMRFMAGLFGLATVACAATDLPTRNIGERPTDKSSFTSSLWEASELYESKIKMSGARITEPALTAYVEDLVCKLAAEHCPDIRVYIVENTTLNALMAPNGMMILHSGLLLRAETEAHLAFVIGHEIGHFVEQHSFERYGATKNALQASAFLTAAMGNFVALGASAAFSREQEIAADGYGVDVLAKHGYDTHAAHRLWQDLTLEMAASRNKRKRRNYLRSSYFNTHPAPEDRVQTLQDMTAQAETKPYLDTAYRAAVRPLLGKWLAEDIADRDFGTSLHLVDRLSGLGTDLGTLEFARGEIYRIRNEEGDAEMALASYQKAIEFEDAPPASWRQIGDWYLKQNNYAAARTALAGYLAKAPNAKDAPLVDSILKGIEEKEGHE